MGLLSIYPGINLIDSTIMVQHFGGMHFLMSFIGCVRSLMAESGLVDILSCAFGGVIICLPEINVHIISVH